MAILIDTGSRLDLAVNPADLEAIGVTADGSGPMNSSIAAGATGTFTSDTESVGIDLALGDLQLPNHPVALVSALQPGLGNMGNEFLDGFVAIFDWSESKVYLDPVFEEGNVPTPPVPPSAALGRDGENNIIGGLVAGAAPARSGRVLDLYAGSWDGEPLKDDEFVISADERTRIGPGSSVTPRCHRRRGAAVPRRLGRPPGQALRSL